MQVADFKQTRRKQTSTKHSLRSSCIRTPSSPRAARVRLSEGKRKTFGDRSECWTRPLQLEDAEMLWVGTLQGPEQEDSGLLPLALHFENSSTTA